MSTRALRSAFSCLLEKGAEHGLTAEQLVLVQRSCLVPDARRPKKRLLGVLPEIVGSRPGCNNDNKASKNNVGGEEEGEGEALRGCDKGNTHRAKCSGDEDALDLILNHFLVNGLWRFGGDGPGVKNQNRKQNMMCVHPLK